MSLIRTMFVNDRERQFAIGVWIASFSLGGAIGPVAGGLVLHFFHWGAVFLIAVPVMALALVLGPLLLPEYRDPDAGRIDFASVVLSLGAALGIVYGLKQLAAYGFAWLPLGVALLGFALGWAFLRRQRRISYPLLDLALFRVAGFSGALSAYVLSVFAMFGIYIFLTQYLQGALGLGPLDAGLATVPWAVGFVVGSLIAPKLAHLVPKQTILVRGLAISALAFATLALLDSAPLGAMIAILIAATIVMSLAMAPVFTIGNDMVIGAAPPERAGAASALSETAAELAGALGIALFGSLGAALYRSALAASLPADVPHEAALAALDTLGGALATAGTLAAATSALLLDAARAAFIDAQRIAALACAGVVAIAALVSRRLLRPSG